VLKVIPFPLNADGFVFDQKLNAQMVAFGDCL